VVQTEIGGERQMARYIVHYAASLVAVALLSRNSMFLLGAGLTAIVTDYVINHLGHQTDENGARKRIALTHSIVTAPIWGTMIALAVGTILVLIESTLSPRLGLEYWQSCGGLHDEARSLCLLLTAVFTILGSTLCGGLTASFVHLTLDSVTNEGIYVPTGTIPWKQILSTIVTAISSTVILPRLVKLKPPGTGREAGEAHGFEYEEENILPRDTVTGFENFRQFKLADITMPKLPPVRTLLHKLPHTDTSGPPEIPMVKYCRECGEKLRTDAVFCTKCGRRTL
jgi:hypothetical protein